MKKLILAQIFLCFTVFNVFAMDSNKNSHPRDRDECQKKYKSCLYDCAAIDRNCIADRSYYLSFPERCGFLKFTLCQFRCEQQLKRDIEKANKAGQGEE